MSDKPEKPMDNPAPEPCCGNCVYYQEPEGKDPMGQCRESPPKVFMVHSQGVGGPQMGFVSAWPPVRVENWCGIFLDKNALPDLGPETLN